VDDVQLSGPSEAERMRSISSFDALKPGTNQRSKSISSKICLLSSARIRAEWTPQHKVCLTVTFSISRLLGNVLQRSRRGPLDAVDCDCGSADHLLPSALYMRISRSAGRKVVRGETLASCTIFLSIGDLARWSHISHTPRDNFTRDR
jgi:hypothetical protein